jgi:hypothetical protein
VPEKAAPECCRNSALGRHQQGNSTRAGSTVGGARRLPPRPPAGLPSDFRAPQNRGAGLGDRHDAAPEQCQDENARENTRNGLDPACGQPFPNPRSARRDWKSRWGGETGVESVLPAGANSVRPHQSVGWWRATGLPALSVAASVTPARPSQPRGTDPQEAPAGCSYRVQRHAASLSSAPDPERTGRDWQPSRRRDRAAPAHRRGDPARRGATHGRGRRGTHPQ